MLHHQAWHTVENIGSEKQTQKAKGNDLYCAQVCITLVVILDKGEISS